jgi:hypothetical protein
MMRALWAVASSMTAGCATFSRVVNVGHFMLGFLVPEDLVALSRPTLEDAAPPRPHIMPNLLLVYRSTLPI